MRPGCPPYMVSHSGLLDLCRATMQVEESNAPPLNFSSVTSDPQIGTMEKVMRRAMPSTPALHLELYTDFTGLHTATFKSQVTYSDAIATLGPRQWHVTVPSAFHIQDVDG